MTRRRQPTTIDELLDPHRVWVTPCGCWLWLGGDDGSGNWWGRGAYGRILRPGTRRVMPVHRYVYETFVGPIPDGYDVDHMCAAWALDVEVIRKCVNPDHLQAIPPKLNQQLKLLRRLGYGTEDMDFDPPPIYAPDLPPLLAPGETEDDLYIPHRDRFGRVLAPIAPALSAEQRDGASRVPQLSALPPPCPRSGLTP